VETVPRRGKRLGKTEKRGWGKGGAAFSRENGGLSSAKEEGVSAGKPGETLRLFLNSRGGWSVERGAEFQVLCVRLVSGNVWCLSSCFGEAAGALRRPLL